MVLKSQGASKLTIPVTSLLATTSSSIDVDMISANIYSATTVTNAKAR